MQYPRIVDDIFATVSLVSLAAITAWLNFDARNPKTVAREAARRSALTQAERDEEDAENWANKVAW